MSKKYKQAFGLGLTSFIRRCYKGMWLVLSIPLVVVLRGISPLLTIRFAKVQTDRLGHIYTIEVYLSEQDLGLRPKRTFDIFYFYPIPSIISNQQVFKMWQQNVYFIPLVHMAYFADRINRLLPGYEKHIVRINTLLNDEKYLKKVPVLFLQIMSVRQFMFHLLF